MATEAQIATFIDRQRQLLKKERDAEIERSSLLLSNCGPKLLEQKGLSLGGLGIVGVNIGLGGKTLVELERPAAYHTSPTFPPHTLRPGDLARIEANASSVTKKAKKPTAEETKGSQPEGVVYKVSDTRIVIAVDSSDPSSEDLDLPERCRVVKLANSVTYDRMEKALERLEKRLTLLRDEKAPPESIHLTKVLMRVTPRSSTQPIRDIKFFDDSLNPSQREAIKFCLESPEVACIHGPPGSDFEPGTGKTHTLIELIRQLTSVSSYNPKPLRLLVCGASNLSVDNILERLLALPVPANGERLKAALAKDVKNELEETLAVLSGKGKGTKGKRPRGAERKKLWDDVKALRKEYRQREGGVVKSVLSESQIVLATCHSAGGRQLLDHDFDVLIIDEATQALEAVCWIPIFKVKKLILAGDPMQLPPTILSLNNEKKTKSALESKAAKTNKTKGSPVPSSTQGDEALDSASDSPVSDSEESELETERSRSSPPEKIMPAKARPLLRLPRTLETTLFDRLESMYGGSIKRMLTIQYRMHSDICAFPSKMLYSSKLTSHASVEGHLLADLPNIRADNEDDRKEMLETPVVYFDTAGCEYFERIDADGDEGSRCNENEATIVKNWVEKLWLMPCIGKVEVGLLPDQIAVITPYQAQVTLLSSLLRPIYGTELEIGSVDGMQGREKEAVIISLVRSNDKREVGFLKEKRRLNVAMTRAKRHLCVVGDSSTICHGGNYLKKWLAWLDANADVKYAGLE
ncbi:hypothetical protein C0995_013786 [Termitomyces sp. Mi166|nr:hypothetical protein C0995_013786 [Termitomyces sp. Mi166\